MRRRLLAALLYFPVRGSAPAPPGVEDVWFDSADGERLHGWWVAAAPPKLGQVLFCSGNAGSVADRLPYAQLLAAAGFDVLLFDYRGYGRSSGRPSEEGTYADARAAREALLARPDAGAGRLLVAGESLGGAVALKLAVEHPPAGVLLQSTFTSVRDVAAVHYGFVPRSVVPDAYPSVRIVGDLRAPLLVLHGDRDEIVPVEQGRALYEAAPEPRRLRVLAGRGHNDLLGRDGSDWIDAIASWVREDVLGAGG